VRKKEGRLVGKYLLRNLSLQAARLAARKVHRTSSERRFSRTQHRPISRYRDRSSQHPRGPATCTGRVHLTRDRQKRFAERGGIKFADPMFGRYCSRAYLQLPVPGFSNLPTTHARHPRRIGSHFRRAVLSPTSAPGRDLPYIGGESSQNKPLCPRLSARDRAIFPNEWERLPHWSPKQKLSLARSRDDGRRGVLVRSDLSSRVQHGSHAQGGSRARSNSVSSNSVSSYARRREMSSLARTGSHVNPLLMVPAPCTLCARPRGDGRFIGCSERNWRILGVTNNSSSSSAR